ncbi:2-succinyl-6-hydroxy-2,4-cyclohexadiene-1-carboxylate synthase [Peribacillus alkalitolerans]|uniref:2-succinyl-6-hydroxy-2, 4-cyclohexadiene-1-carboxylate synthase n=1 Tax=Peribacillus alkalitolerans TaxID=1550385 RepID=UPI0013D53671|nr:2-succinyl-6-hydroxy-2,4-cyclohexadiene-1-carboxylate synthase [Peribacillus alkalitolerans]
MKFLSNHVEYNVEVHGSSSSSSVLLLHGFTGDLHTWDHLVNVLSKDYQTISIDIIGHGLTGSPDYSERYTMESVCRDIVAILDSLSIEKVHLVGYSMGGRLALSFAHLYQGYVSSLVLESASPGLSTIEERLNRRVADEGLAKKLEDQGLEAFIDFWENIPLFKSLKSLPLETQNHIRRQRMNNTIVGLSNSLRGMGTGVQPSWWDHLSQLKIPVLLLTGELDEKFVRIAELMCSHIKDVQWDNILGAGHAIHVELPEKFGKIVSGFLSKIEGGKIT